LLARLGGNETLIILTWKLLTWKLLTWKRNDLDRVLKSAVQSIGESDGEFRSQKIDIQLKIARRVKPVNHHRAASAVGRTHQIKR
jgi:hypothetical protein